MRCFPVLLLLLLLLAPRPAAAAITPMSALRCTIVRAVNGSTGEPTGMEGRSAVLSRSEVTVDGRHFTAQEASHDAHGSEIVRYRIARAGLAFEATAIRKRDDIGEEHVIRLTGTCAPEIP